MRADVPTCSTRPVPVRLRSGWSILTTIAWGVGATTAIGPDVSHYQGTINWASVKAAGVGFAIAKATEGSGYVDAQFKANWQVRSANFLLRV